MIFLKNFRGDRFYQYYIDYWQNLSPIIVKSFQVFIYKNNNMKNTHNTNYGQMPPPLESEIFRHIAHINTILFFDFFALY